MLVPFVLVFLFLGKTFFFAPYIACAVYLAAVFTDAVDGSFARRTKTVSAMGKFLDPISDKIFVNGIMTALIFTGVFFHGRDSALTYINAACIIVMLTREFAISGIRQIAAERGTVIASDKYGKIKTVLTFISFGMYILATAESGNETVDLISDAARWGGLVFFYAAAVFSVLSGINYYLQNKDALKG
jgi:CDP-diacylglycerol--glycerol-3-phosphate 3-phosphatidyltransferase